MAKKDKLDVSAGAAKALTHNPFGALAGERAPAAANAPSDAAAGADVGVGAAKPPRGRLVLRREKKRRGGKTVVVISGFATRPDLASAAIAELAQDLKQQLGCGGAVESHAGQAEIVLQGDQPARVAEWLRARGFRVDGIS